MLFWKRVFERTGATVGSQKSLLVQQPVIPCFPTTIKITLRFTSYFRCKLCTAKFVSNNNKTLLPKNKSLRAFILFYFINFNIKREMLKSAIDDTKKKPKERVSE